MKMTTTIHPYRLLCAFLVSGSLLSAVAEGGATPHDNDHRRVVQAPSHYSYAMHHSKGKGGYTIMSKGKGKGSMRGKGKGSSKKMKKSAKGKGKGYSPPSYKGYSPPSNKGYYKGKGGLGGGPGMMTPPTQFPTFDSNLIDTAAPTRSCNEEDCCTDIDCGDAAMYECRANVCLLRECSLDSNGNNPPLNIECCDD